ncbi:MAG: glycosyltransferase [Thermoanaerobaculia bacterium]
MTEDHRAVFAALHDLLGGVRSGSDLAALAEGLEILVYEVNHPGYPDLLVDVSGELETLRRAMSAYGSQEERHPYLQAAIGLRRFRTHTLAPEVEAAEGYRRLGLSDFTTRGPAALIEHLGGVPPRYEVNEGALVSVVVRTRDRPVLLAQALASLFASTWRSAEILLVNDGGASPEVAERTPLPVRQIDLPENRGRAAAANEGIAAARGEYVTFLDDDDLVEPEHLETLVRLAAATGQRVVYTDAAVTIHEPDADAGWKCVERRLPYSRDFDRERLLVDNYIPFHTLLVERALLAEVGPVDTTLPFFEDWDLILRLAQRANFVHLAKVTCEYRHFRGSDHQILGERASDHGEFARRKAQVLEKHRELLRPEVLAGIVDRLRAEAVFAAEATASERAERARERAELGGELTRQRLALAERDRTLASNWAEIERLNGQIEEMEKTRAWRLHRFVERARGR